MQTFTDIPSVAREQIRHIAEVCERKKPLLAVRCITYNHEAFLRDTLEGFVRQVADFPFVVVVHEDVSTDGTARVLREYAERYPDVILPIFEEQNQFSKRDGTLNRIMTTATAATGARYVAFCDGDDYWKSPDKLRRQVHFLESHPDFAMCFHNATVHNETDGTDTPFAPLESREYTLQEALRNWSIIPSASIVFRAGLYDSPLFAKCVQSKGLIIEDLPLAIRSFEAGRVFGFAESMSVYRLQPAGWTQLKKVSPEFYLYLIRQAAELKRIFAKHLGKSSSQRIAQHSLAAMSALKEGKTALALKILWIALRSAPASTARAYFQSLAGALSAKFSHKAAPRIA